MVGFLFNRLLYIFAILFAVLFQPELRRALETVGLRTSNATNPFKHSESAMTEEEMTSFIKEISSACKEMSRTYTGALILIERNTKLNELLSQENVVAFDSEVTSSVLQSIFYKGSPMHDGGLLIRDGRIIAARCHVPLSVTMHSLERSGTRHRAALGMAEESDAVVLVVSEETGALSLAYEAIKTGGSMPAVFNAANEYAASEFLHNRIMFSRIPEIIAEAMSKHKLIANPTVDDILAIKEEYEF